MDNLEIAAALAEAADLLDVQGTEPFRARAYRHAARTVSVLTRPLAEMLVRGEDLTELPGIGEELAAHIRDLIETGTFRRLRELERHLPATLVELMKLDGVGPKRARALYERLGIRDMADLERALEKGRVTALPGFGAKTVERIGRSIAEVRARGTRIRLIDADRIADSLLAWMRQAPGLVDVVAAGSYRRRAETIGDLDLLAVGGRAAGVMKHFTRYPDAARVEAAGGTRGTIVLRSGLHVDLRIVPKRCFGAALHYFTGSKPHNIAVRRLGVERGLRISEYGVFRLRPGSRGGAQRAGGQDEKDVFEAVGLPWIPPELREDRGEIAAAREGRLPRLIELADIRGDLQMHTDWSDGRDSIEAMAAACAARGYEYVAITDHSEAARIAHGMTAAAATRQARAITAAAKAVAGIRILRGMEVDIRADGSLDAEESLLRRLDIVVVSVHSSFGMTRQRMTDRIIRALAQPNVDVLAHPTGRLINERPPYELDLEAVLSAAAEHDVAVEINAQPDRLDLNDLQARRAQELGVRLVINTDAHSTESLDFMRYGVDQARRAWLQAEAVLNTLGLDELERWLARRRRPARTGRKKRVRSTSR